VSDFDPLHPGQVLGELATALYEGI